MTPIVETEDGKMQWKERREKCITCGAILFWEGHPFLRSWRCPNKCEKVMEDKPLVCCQKAITIERERILKLASENASPCMKCGSVQCALCFEDLRKILSQSPDQEGKR